MIHKVFLMFFVFSLVACTKRKELEENEIVIAIIGSSTAEGNYLQNRNESWPNRLSDYLKEDADVMNFACSGYTTYHFLPQSESGTENRPSVDSSRNIDAILTEIPDVLIISLPTNDIANGYSKEEYLHNLKILVNHAIEYGVDDVLICTTQPRNLSVKNREVLRSCKDDILKTYQQNAVDFWTPLCGDNNLLQSSVDIGDGIHPNGEGHRLLFFQMKEKIDSIIEIRSVSDRFESMIVQHSNNSFLK
ncbi:MAG: SGNH/GDSL hydrolase family protein [Breznakibacter sp.]